MVIVYVMAEKRFEPSRAVLTERTYPVEAEMFFTNHSIYFERSIRK